jgi:hypothetical protein
VQELVHLKVKQGDEDESPTTRLENLKKRDDLYEAAIDIVIREGRGSCSLLQRALGIGYGRAARLIDFMAEDGIVGQYNGSQAREVVISISDWEAMKAGQAPSADEESAGKRNRIRMDSAAAPPAPKSPSTAWPPLSAQTCHQRKSRRSTSRSVCRTTNWIPQRTTKRKNSSKRSMSRRLSKWIKKKKKKKIRTTKKKTDLWQSLGRD